MRIRESDSLMRRVLAFVLAVALTFANACVSATPQKKAYQVLDGIQTTVETAMTVAGDLYKRGVIGDTEKSKILDAYVIYQKAMSTAGYALMATSENGDFSLILADASKAASALIDLINSLKAKDTPIAVRPPPAK